MSDKQFKKYYKTDDHIDNNNIIINEYLKNITDSYNTIINIVGKYTINNSIIYIIDNTINCQTRGVLIKSNDIYEGYCLLCPMFQTMCFLMDKNGDIGCRTNKKRHYFWCAGTSYQVETRWYENPVFGQHIHYSRNSFTFGQRRARCSRGTTRLFCGASIQRGFDRNSQFIYN